VRLKPCLLHQALAVIAGRDQEGFAHTAPENTSSNSVPVPDVDKQSGRRQLVVRLCVWVFVYSVLFVVCLCFMVFRVLTSLVAWRLPCRLQASQELMDAASSLRCACVCVCVCVCVVFA
jgi:hypothetical protein